MSLKLPHLPIARHLPRTGVSRARGQGMLEFALLLPLLVLIVFGATDLGRAFQVLIAVTNASREGARRATLDWPKFNPIGNLNIVNAAVEEAKLSYIDITIAGVTVSCPEGCVHAKPVHVRVCYQFKFLTLIFFTGPIDICRSTEMRLP